MRDCLRLSIRSPMRFRLHTSAASSIEIYTDPISSGIAKLLFPRESEGKPAAVIPLISSHPSQLTRQFFGPLRRDQLSPVVRLFLPLLVDGGFRGSQRRDIQCEFRCSTLEGIGGGIRPSVEFSSPILLSAQRWRNQGVDRAAPSTLPGEYVVCGASSSVTVIASAVHHLGTTSHLTIPPLESRTNHSQPFAPGLKSPPRFAIAVPPIIAPALVWALTKIVPTWKLSVTAPTCVVVDVDRSGDGRVHCVMCWT